MNNLIKVVEFENEKGITVKEAIEMLQQCDEDAILISQVGMSAASIKKLETGFFKLQGCNSFILDVITQDNNKAYGNLNIQMGLDNGTLAKAVILSPFIGIDNDEEEEED